MKNIYFNATIIALFLNLSALNAQDTTLEPNPVSISGFDVSDYEAVAYSTLTNEGSVMVDYTWVRNEVEVTEGWSTAICDKNACYLSGVSSQSFDLAPGEESNIDVHLYPNGIEGGAVVEVTITDDNNSENSITGVYLFNSTLSAPERLNEALKVFPNPASSFFNIEGEEEISLVEIYTIEGSLVKEVQIFGKSRIDVSDLPRGNYILRLKDSNHVNVSGNLLTLK